MTVWYGGRVPTKLGPYEIVSPLGPGVAIRYWRVLKTCWSTSGWRDLLADFTTGPQTRLIAIKVIRVPGNPLIKGTFWLDDVKLTLAQTLAADH